MSAIQHVRRGALIVAVACALAACGGKDDAGAETTAAAPAAAPAAAAPTPESVVASNVSAMSIDQLREKAATAYNENRLYAPAGNNAMEYYLALRDKQPGDAAASSALIDLMPMTVIATEQSLKREDFEEAVRLLALIEKADANHPSLARLKEAVQKSQADAKKRAETQRLTAEEEAKRQQELERQRIEDQRKLQEQQKQQALLEQQRLKQEAEKLAAAQKEAAAKEAAAKEAAAREPEKSQPAATRAPARVELELVTVSRPRFPRAAQRVGATANVQVEFTVGTDGSVTNARVVSSDAPRQFEREFEREALSAVKRWKFKPIPQATTSRRTISFER